jgi:hypothetical protein
MDLRFAKWQVRNIDADEDQQQLTPGQQGGKQGDMKNLGEANEAAMAQVAKEQ